MIAALAVIIVALLSGYMNPSRDILFEDAEITQRKMTSFPPVCYSSAAMAFYCSAAIVSAESCYLIGEQVMPVLLLWMPGTGGKVKYYEIHTPTNHTAAGPSTRFLTIYQTPQSTK